MESANKRQNKLRVALVVSALSLGILYQFVPYGHLILYPFTLLYTWTHEMGHGLTALICGEQFQTLRIFSNGAGLALITASSPLTSVLTSAGGLLAPPFLGMVALMLARSFARFFLFGISLLMLASLVFWVRTPIGFITIGSLSIFLTLIAIYANQTGRIWVTQFLGLVLVLFTVTRIDYLFVAKAEGTGQDGPSDIAAIADILGGPFQMWGGLLAGISFLFLLIGLYASWRAPRKRGRQQS